MTEFAYIDDELHAEEVCITTLANAVGTPFHVYSTRQITSNFQEYERAFSDVPHLVCYSLKANSNLAVIRLLANMNAGFDAVSGGEIAKAVAAGARPSRIVFSGVGKTREEIRYALETGIRQFNVESIPELIQLNEMAAGMDRIASVAFRINPDVDANTHSKISTGKSGDKFGISLHEIPEASELTNGLGNIRLDGLDLHIGSQITSLAPFREAFTMMAELVRHMRGEGHRIASIDIGGGLGVAYRKGVDTPPSQQDYASLVKEVLGPLNCEILIEPGRSVLGNAGMLVATVIYRKTGENRNFLVLDAAMNDLMRPALYGAHHDLVPVIKPALGSETSHLDIVGPVCESSDTFALGLEMPHLEPGDRVAFLDTGAYGAVMASEYNCRPLVPEVLVGHDKWAIVRHRPTHEDMFKRETIPDWIGDRHLWSGILHLFA